ncbi:MAG TPA: hypothetical protein PKL52_01875 [Tenuifilaceae bacterium]|nr:hypothetical protein [Tenuifilaceae bacterium]
MMRFNLKRGSVDAARRNIRAYSERMDRVIVSRLEYVLEELKNHAKLNAGYNFHTGNLNSSIGGGVYKNGHLIHTRGFDVVQGGDDGAKVGLAYLNELALKGRSTYSVVVVAGMDYASYVENLHGKNVLAKTEMVAGEMIEWAFRVLK